jgi:iron complex outermembrane recepter protein
MKHFFTSITLLFAISFSYAQTSITGKLISENKYAIPSATISITAKGITKNTNTNNEGNFSFTALTKGTYNLTITAIGFETLLETVVVDNNKTTNIELTLITKTNALPTVEVVGRNAKKYTSDYSFSATRTAALVKDIPQSISTVTKELIADKNAFQLSDAIKIASGVIPSSFYNQFAIRGVTQNEEGQIINGMRTRQYYFLQPLTTHIERVEVIKGPASATFASVDPGGSINMVTKKPLAVNRKEVGITMGSFSTMRGTLDFTGPLNEDKTLLYRINAAYQEAKSYRDLVLNNSVLISPSLSYIPNDRTNVNVEMIMSNMNGNLDRGQPIFGAVAGVTNLNSTPISLNLGASNDFFKSKEFIGTATFSHKFSKAISFNAAYMKQTWTEDLQEHRTTNAFALDTTNTPVTNLAGMQFVQRKQFWNIDNVNAYFNFDFKTGQAKHQLLVGYDLNSWEKTKGGGQNAARGFLLNNGNVAASFVRANAANYQTINVGGNILPRPNVNYFDLTNPQYTVRNINDYNMNVRTAVPAALTTNNAIYIQEQLQWKKFTVLLSLRNEWYKDITNYESPNELSFTNVKLLPRFGVTYAVTKNVNVYGTYLEGYQPQSNTVTLMPNTGSFFQTSKSAAQFAPLISDLKEVGTKIDLFKNKLRLNAAIYEINQKNLLQNADVPAFPDSLTTRGGERSQGFEMDIAGFILPNWQINASYSYIDARIVEDRDPLLKNARKQNTPYHSGNIWTRYNFAHGSKLKGLGIGLGLQAMGNRVPWFTRAFEIPGYSVVDMALYYTPGKSNMQLALNAGNIFNKTYWLGAQNYLRLFPGAPRNVMLTATYKF